MLFDSLQVPADLPTANSLANGLEWRRETPLWRGLRLAPFCFAARSDRPERRELALGINGNHKPERRRQASP